MKLRLGKVIFSESRRPEFGQAKVNAVFPCLFWDVSRGRGAQSQPESPFCLQKTDAEEVLGARLQVWCGKREAFWHAAVQEYTWCVINAFPSLMSDPACTPCVSVTGVGQ